MAHETGRTVAAALIAVVISGLLILALLALLPLLSNHSDSFAALFSRMADIVASLKAHLPDWLSAYIPVNGEDLQAEATRLLREHGTYAQSIGQDVGKFMAHVVIGMIIGGLVLASGVGRPPAIAAALACAHGENPDIRARLPPRGVAQVRISALNTFLTAVYLALILPLIGIQLPLIKTMIVLTFLVGLIPVAGSRVEHRGGDRQPERLATRGAGFAGVPDRHSQARIFHQRSHRRLADQCTGLGDPYRDDRHGVGVWDAGDCGGADLLCVP